MPRMISPELDAPQSSVAEEQHEYKTVTAARLNNPAYPSRDTHEGPFNTLILAYRLSPEERALIAAGADVYLSMLTFGGPLQPHNLFVGKQAVADAYGIEAR